MSSAPARPGQVTMAGWLVILGSVAVVLEAYAAISGLHTLETRETVQQMLDEPSFQWIQLSMTSALSMLRVVAMVAGACAAAAAILGWFALQRDKRARIVLSVLAVPILLTAAVGGGFMGSIVAAAVVMLWLQPARDWFDGIVRPREARPEPPRPVHPPQPPPTFQPPTGPPEDGAEPRAYEGFGTPTAGERPEATWAPPNPEDRLGASRPAPYTWPPPSAARTAPRPAGVLWACILTWAGAGLTALFASSILMLALVSPDLLVGEADTAEARAFTDWASSTGGLLLLAGCVVWAAGAALLALYALLRRPWARAALMTCAWAASAVALVVGLTVFPVAIVLSMLGSATAFALLRPDAREWYTGP